MLCAGDLAHGVMEGKAEHLDMEVDGVAGQIAFRPAPVAVFHDEAGIDWQRKIARLADDELDTMFLIRNGGQATYIDRLRASA